MEDLVEIARDPRVRVTAGEPVVALEGGLQPFLFCSSRGTLVMQAQLPEKPYGTKDKMVYASRMATTVSRDGGRSWRPFVHLAGHDEANLEGGVVELRDGTILMLDTYVVPGTAQGKGVGELWVSRDDWKTLEGPRDVPFTLPRVNFDASSDDGGHQHRAARLHRSILELPGGELLTTMYSWYPEDTAPCSYMPKMMKTRSVIVRSSDGGDSWTAGATIAADPAVGTEGFGEPVVERVSVGPLKGRLVCLMRTGRDLYGCHSDDGGLTWSRYAAVAFPGVDIYAVEAWQGRFANGTDDLTRRYPWMQGAVVDPDLIEMRSGVFACAFGVRIPEKACWADPGYPRNGNYLAFSLDHGRTWTHVVELTSGVLTTHYMGVRELRDGELAVAYDLGAWGKPGRRAMCRSVRVKL